MFMRRQCHPTCFLFITLLLFFGCASATTGTDGDGGGGLITLNVFAAASLTDAFREIGENFSAANPGTEVVFNFAGSNQLATQLREGAPEDLFASANPAQLMAVIDSGQIISGTQRTFAHNRLVLITPSDNPAGLTTLQDLARPGVKVIFAAAEVPVGQYTQIFLDNAATGNAPRDALAADYKDAVLANVVSYESSVRAVLTKIMLGEGDAGIVYTSDVGAAVAAVGQIEIPDEFNTIASYPIAPLADSAHPAMAQQFLDYLLAPAGQQVLMRFGFLAVRSDE